MGHPRDASDNWLSIDELATFFAVHMPTWWTRKKGNDFEAKPFRHKRFGLAQRCGCCGRGIIVHETLLLDHCKVCGGKVRKVYR